MSSRRPQQPNQSGLDEAVKQLSEAAAARKCWHCGCLHGSLRAIEGAYPAGVAPEALAGIVELARSRLSDVEYDCPGCKMCWPALAINALGVEGEVCASEHYRNDDVLDVVIEGSSPVEHYIPAIEKGLVSRLDHAAYLGKELARAAQALLKGGTYVQDGAPELQSALRAAKEFSIEPAGCGCGSSCGENRSQRHA